MKRKIFSVLIALVLVCSFSLVTAVPVAAQGAVPDRATAITDAADRLVTLQNTDGGFPWVAPGDGTSYTNILGVSAMGILKAHELDDKASYKTALAEAYKYVEDNPPTYTWDVSKWTETTAGVDSFADVTFLVWLAEAAADADLLTAIGEEFATDIADLAKVRWDGRVNHLGDTDGDAIGTATAMAEYIRDARFGQEYYDCIPWDLEAGVKAALALDSYYGGQGYDTQADDIAEVIYDSLYGAPTYFDRNNTSQEGYILGLTGALEAFVEVGSHPDDATELKAILLEHQQDGGYWNFHGVTPVEECVQHTAYAVMALVKQGDDDAVIAARKGADWLVKSQNPDGGWFAEGGVLPKFPEVDSEAAWALATAQAPVTIGPMGYYSIQSAIDSASPNDAINVAAGIYDEQVVIGKSLTLQGTGDTTVIQPSGVDILTTTKTTPWLGIQTRKMAAIVFVDTAGTVTVKDLKIDGSNLTALPEGIGPDDWVTGLAYLETSGTIDTVTVENMNMGDNPRTCGIWTSAIATASSVEVTYCTATNYNRAGVYGLGGQLTVDFNHNIITGPGSHTKQVPNSIFILEGCNGSATYNDCSSNYYDPAVPDEYRATGIGTYNAGANVTFAYNIIHEVQNAFALSNNTIGTIVEYNTVYDCHTGVRLEAGAANSVIQYNDIHDNDFAIRCGVMGDGNEAHYNNFVNNLGLEWTNVKEAFPNTYEGAVCNLHPTYRLDATNNWWGQSSGPAEGAIVGKVDVNPWLLEEDGDSYDKTLALNPDWSIVSPDCELASWDVVDSVGLVYAYDDGAFVEVVELDAITPVFIKTVDGGGVGFNYAESSQGIFTTNLEAGWNLIGIPATSGSSYDVLSPLRYGANNEVALATLASQGNYNPSEESFYRATLSTNDWGELPNLYPFDGYWAYMNVAKEFGVVVVVGEPTLK